MDFLKDNVRNILSIILVFLCFSVLFVSINMQIEDKNRDIIMLILGSILATLTTVVGYYFGSSKGSTDKSIAINKKMKTEDCEENGE